MGLIVLTWSIALYPFQNPDHHPDLNLPRAQGVSPSEITQWCCKILGAGQETIPQLLTHSPLASAAAVVSLSSALSLTSLHRDPCAQDLSCCLAFSILLNPDSKVSKSSWEQSPAGQRLRTGPGLVQTSGFCSLDGLLLSGSGWEGADMVGGVNSTELANSKSPSAWKGRMLASVTSVWDSEISIASKRRQNEQYALD